MSFLAAPARPRRRPTLLDGGFILLSLGISIASVGPWSLLFPSDSAPRLAIVVVAALSVLTVASMRIVLDAGAVATLAVTAAASFVVAVVTAVLTEGWGSVLPLLGSVVDGLPRALTTRLPLGTVSDTFGAVAILVWLVTATVALVVVDRRPAAVVTGTVAAGHAAALASVAGGLDGTETLAGRRIAALIVGVLAYAGLRGIVESGHLARRSVVARSVSGVLTIALVLLLVLVLAVRPDAGSDAASLRYDPPPRAEVAPDPVPLVQVLRLGARDSDPDRVIARVTVGTAPGAGWNGHLVIARYGTTDYVSGGQRWRTLDGFVPTGGVDPLREVSLTGGGERSLELEITLEEPESLGGWLPHPRPLDRIERVATAANGQGLILADPTACGEGCRYVVRGLSSSVLEELGPGIGSTSSPSELAEVTGGLLTGRPFPAPEPGQGPPRPQRQVCEALLPRLERQGIGCDEPADVATLLTVGLRAVKERGLISRSDGAVTALASSERLSDVLTLLRAPDGTAVADPMQFATAYALLLQHFQIDAFLTIGFRASPCTGTIDGRAELTGACAEGSVVDLRARDAWSWVDLQIDGIGWITLDASPAEGETQQPEAEEQARDDRTPPVPERGSAASLLVTEPEILVETSEEQTAPPLLPWVFGGLLTLLAALLPNGVIRLARLRRRRSGTPEEVAVASLHELLEALHDAGARDLRARTTREIIELAADLGGTEASDQPDGAPEDRLPSGTGRSLWSTASERAAPLVPVQRSADVVICSGRGVTAAEADQAWGISREWSRRVRRRSGLRRRAGALLVPPPSRLTR